MMKYTISINFKSPFTVDSIVRRQLEQNLAIWEKTTVDQNGKLHLPDVDELIRKVHLRLAQEAQQRTVESQLLLGLDK